MSAPLSDTLPVSPEAADLAYAEGFEEGYAEGAANRAAERDALKRRVAGITLTVLAELLVIALLLTLGWNLSQGEEDAPKITTIEARNISSDPPTAAEEPSQSASEQQAQPVPQPPEPAQAPPPDLPNPLQLNPQPAPLPAPSPAPQPKPSPTPRPTTPAAPAGPPAQVYGPPDTGPPGGQFDSQRVGTAPNGEPMYAARWYREPTRQELSGYLSTATAPAYALITCKTVPDFYVEDCVLLGESPSGSQIGRAVMAAAWQFRVRPAIVGGRSQVGSWVRIRIDYRQTVRR